VNEPTGVKRAVNAAWDKLPEVLITSITALAVFGFGLWINNRDLRSSIDGVISEQAAPRLCARVGECGQCQRFADSIIDIRQTITRTEGHIDAHNRESDEWKNRIRELEKRVIDLNTRPSSRPDPFTGTEGRALEERIRGLEGKK
jgi:hypothetical protein